MAPKEIFQGYGLLGQAFTCLKILVIYRKWEVSEVDEGDLGTGMAGTFRSDFNDFLVPGLAAKAAAEGENSRGHQVAPSVLNGAVSVVPHG